MVEPDGEVEEGAGAANGAEPPVPPTPGLLPAKGPTVERIHYAQRRALLLPLGVKGLPNEASAYTGVRIKVGFYEYGEAFEIKENWLTYDDPGRMLDRNWADGRHNVRACPRLAVATRLAPRAVRAVPPPPVTFVVTRGPTSWQARSKIRTR